jgi:leader peptidase (prepilin peptidase)/N-methyltransferase
MLATWPILLTLGSGLFAIGTVVGSFLNVCIYRLAWQKSVIWPGSHCPRCLRPIEARDNIPVVGWILLRGACRRCGGRIAPRYPLVEALVGLLFLGLFAVDVALAPRTLWGEIPASTLLVWAYHATLTALLVVATFIDYDFTIIPDELTVTGMVLGLLGGMLAPTIRPLPSTATTALGGLAVGIVGLVAGGSLTWTVRAAGTLVLRLLGRLEPGQDAMGVGDVTLLAMIGAYLGWQAAVLTFFIAPFFGLAHAIWKLITYIGKRLAGGKLTTADREIPFGPYLSMAAVALILSWPWFWPRYAEGLFRELGMIFWTVFEMLIS